VAGYSELYKRDYAPASYCNEVKKVVAAARTKHGPNSRDIRAVRSGRSRSEAYAASDSNSVRVR